MKIVKAHKIKLYPSKSQGKLLVQSCGVARFSFNWALSKWQEGYKNGAKQSAYSLIKHLNSIKRKDFPWMQETSKTCSQYAIHNVEAAFKKMWKEKSGYPKFKKRGCKDSFVAVENKQTFKQDNLKIRLPKIGWVRCAENLKFNGDVNNVVVKRVANVWFAIINIQTKESIPALKELSGDKQATVGIDLGIKSMMVLSNGFVYHNPKSLKSNLKSLKRLQRGLSRKTFGSSNRKKQQIRVARKHYRIVNIRKNAIHQATSEIVKKYDKIVIETLRPKNMVKNRCLSMAISDVSFGEIVRQLSYKCTWAGKQLVMANQWFPSSKICSNCGNKKDKLSLSERLFTCDICGLKIDRDLNASINLANYSPTPKFGGSKAFGERTESNRVQSSSMKNEIDKLSNQIVQNAHHLKNL